MPENNEIFTIVVKCWSMNSSCKANQIDFEKYYSVKFCLSLLKTIHSDNNSWLQLRCSKVSYIIGSVTRQGLCMDFLPSRNKYKVKKKHMQMCVTLCLDTDIKINYSDSTVL